MRERLSEMGRTEKGRESGAALVVALLVMVVCALLGAISIMTSNTDIQIAQNEKVYHEALMNAEAGLQWLRTQDLSSLSSQSSMSGLNVSLSSAGKPKGILFEIPSPPVRAWQDPKGGNQWVYRVRSLGRDRNQRGQVLLEAEIRPAGKRFTPVTSSGYAGSD